MSDKWMLPQPNGNGPNRVVPSNTRCPRRPDVFKPQKWAFMPVEYSKVQYRDRARPVWPQCCGTESTRYDLPAAYDLELGICISRCQYTRHNLGFRWTAMTRVSSKRAPVSGCNHTVQFAFLLKPAMLRKTVVCTTPSAENTGQLSSDRNCSKNQRWPSSGMPQRELNVDEVGR